MEAVQSFRFCAQFQRPLPTLQAVTAEQVPEPYHQLLVHDHDMTGTLERFHNDTIHLQTLEVIRDVQKELLYRQVLLKTEQEKVVEFGAIKIYLTGFGEPALSKILGCLQPLGGILNELNIDYHGRPYGYFRVSSQDPLPGLLSFSSGQTLYGRQNRLERPDGSVIADVLEILPPV